MKKYLLFFLTALILIPGSTFAQSNGYKCVNNSCEACSLGEANCIEGSCTPGICESASFVPPTITNLKELAELQNGNAIRIRGYGQSEAQIVFVVNNNEIDNSEYLVKSDNTFDYTINPDINEDGKYILQAYLKSASGQESDKSKAVELTIDATPPDITLGEIEDFSEFENILVTGNTDPGSMITVFRDEALVYETGSDSNGNFDIILSLEDGDNRFTLKVKDIAGNEGIKDFSVDFDASSSASIEIENVSGSIVELSVPSGIVIVEVFQNGDLIDKIDVLDNSASYNVTDLLSGITSKVSFVGIDAAGNRTKEVIYTKTNTLTIAGIILGGIIILILLLYLINLIIKGKIKIPGIKRTNSSQKSIEWYANHKEEIESVNVNNKSTKSEKGSRRMKKEY